jgi:hypothetical protein
MAGREDLEAAKRARAVLEGELDHVDRELASLQPLAERRAEIEKELRSAEEALERTRREVGLLLLPRVRVASPCPERWEGMSGDDRARHCGRCDKHVFDLSALTAREAEELLASKGESMCVRFYRRADGTVMTSDCEVGTAQRRRRYLVLAGVTASIAAAAVLAAPTQGVPAFVPPPIDVPKPLPELAAPNEGVVPPPTREADDYEEVGLLMMEW